MSLRTSAARSEYPIVRCPGCGQPMMLTGIEAVVCGKELERVTYTCELCGMRTERFVKPSAGGSGR
jgi:DNA-directed RNA polymerase subunit RPC12/RpoP